MSRSYKEVTRRERKEGVKGCRTCYRPELSYLQNSISISGFMRFVQDHLTPDEDVWDYHYDVLLERYEGEGRFYLEDGYIYWDIPEVLMKLKQFQRLIGILKDDGEMAGRTGTISPQEKLEI